MDTKRTVLIINAQLFDRKLFGNILEPEYTVINVQDETEALEVLHEYQETRPISAVLLDTKTDERDQYKVLEEIRKDDSFSMIPIIVTTQEAGDEAGLEALKHGAADFISHPYHPEIVRLRLENLIQAREAKAALNVLEVDTLTGLLTKEAFFHKVGQMLKSGKSGYVIVAADMERFKVFNDTFGEAEGDRLLRRIANELRKTFGEEPFISHGYADQFFLLLQKDKGLEEKLLKLSKNMQNYFPNTKIIVKFGIYEIALQDTVVRAMCDRAALAIGVIKNQYDKVFCYYNDTFREKLIVEQKITSVMNQALFERQFQVYYQPKFDAQTESIVGAEALVRWIHPEFGFLSPGEFIPVFEKNGFITEMDKYVWEEVCIFLKKQKEHRKESIPVSVNVSRKDIYNEDLPNYFPKLMKKYGLENRLLHLEVTESAYSENPQQLIKVVTQLREKGFVIEMDDFGSGYSSLNALSEIPIDVLKLDMKFIQNEFMHKNSNNIICSIINLAKWMNLLIVAEGVENKEQLERLRELQCNIIQGYYFAKPMRESDLEKFLEEKEVQPVYDVDSYIRNSIVKREGMVETNLMLVVDDLAFNRTILRDYFEGKYNIREFDNGSSAWEFIQRNYEAIKIIMLDLYMPGMDGFELLTLLKKNKLYQQIPVIVTSRAGEDLEKRIPEIRVDGLLSKPYLREEAWQLVADTLINRVRGGKKDKIKYQRNDMEVFETSFDKLTGILNKNGFEQEVRRFLRGAEAGVLILLRVDHFQELVGGKDEIVKENLLTSVVEILQNSVRDYDLIGHMEENLFALFLKASMSRDRLENRMKRLQKSLNFQFYGIEISCTFGACPCIGEDHDFQILYENARRAFLIAEAEGTNRYWISERVIKNSVF